MPPQSPAHKKILAGFAKALRARREALKFSQAAVARAADISPKTLCNTEAGNNFPSMPVYLALCRILKLPVPPLL